MTDDQTEVNKKGFGEGFLQDPIICGMGLARAPHSGTWSPDGKTIAFVCAKRDGKSHIWTLPCAGGAPVRITHEPVWLEMSDLVDRRDVAGGPRWSPDGLYFAYVALTKAGSTSIYVIPSTGGEAVQVSSYPRCTVCPSWLPHAECDRTPRWSPDGKRIAFVSSRDGPDQIWVVEVNSSVGPLQVTYDRYDNNDIQWSPDGKQIAYASQRNAQDIFRSALCTVSLPEGEVKQLTDGLQSNDRTPRWSPDGTRIAFVSDRSGYDDLWLMSKDGEGLTRLTEGGGDHADPRWSPDGRFLAYTVTRHGNVDIWVSSVDGSSRRRLTTEDGVHQAPLWSPDGREILYLSEGPTCGRELYKVSVDGGPPQQLTHSMIRDDTAVDPVVPETITFPSEDGLQIEGFLYRPRELIPGQKYPALMWIHGGPNGLFSNRWYPLFQYLVKRGYVVLAPNCRGSTGYGRSFLEDNLDFWMGRDTLDWLNAVEFLKGLGYVDVERLAIWGSSYGGSAVYWALGKFPHLFKAGICHYGGSDMIQSYDDTRSRHVRRLFKRLMGSLPIQNMPLWVERSGITYVDQVEAPLMILQGDVDIGVHPRQAQRVADALWAQGKVCELTIYKGEGHGFSGAETIADAISKIESFLERYL